jgi:hypothetical protein
MQRIDLPGFPGLCVSVYEPCKVPEAPSNLVKQFQQHSVSFQCVKGSLNVWVKSLTASLFESRPEIAKWHDKVEGGIRTAFLSTEPVLMRAS